MTAPFSTAWVRTTRFGTLAAVPMPSGLEPVGQEVLAQLHPREAALATAERGRRQIELAGGRLAWRAAAKERGLDGSFPLLADSARAPLPPPGFSVSLTHKEDLALALVAPDADGLVGIDLEGGARDRSSIRTRVCRPEELREVDALAEAERWPNVMVRFAVKEAVYKAIAPRLGRFFGFQAARVDVLSREAARVTMFLEPDDPAFDVECALEWLDDGRLLAMVRAQVTSARR
ncbi:MAG: 4'-phosphopantetheinyl transferase superfamily protein [Myxococcaceae bacterium]|nr:4'-phosphopantetheinyl transferase superfamily protein [Myxococcaceae bacterium]